MAMDRLTASTSYGDFKGTVSADSGKMSSVASWMRSNGLLSNGEVLVGLQLSGHGDRPTFSFTANALVMDISGYGSVQEKTAASAHPTDVMRRKMNISLNDFFAIFGQFDMVMLTKGVALSDETAKFI